MIIPSSSWRKTFSFEVRIPLWTDSWLLFLLLLCPTLYLTTLQPTKTFSTPVLYSLPLFLLDFTIIVSDKWQDFLRLFYILIPSLLSAREVASQNLSAKWMIMFTIQSSKPWFKCSAISLEATAVEHHLCHLSLAMVRQIQLILKSSSAVLYHNGG